YEVPDNLNYDFMKEYSSILSLPLIHYGIIFPLAVAGILFSLTRWHRYLLLYLIILSYVIFLMLFFITSRYRIPIAPYLILFASFALFSLVRFAKERNYNAIVLFFLIFIFAFLFSNIVPEEEKKRFEAQSHDSLGSAYYQANERDAATREFEYAIFLLPANPGISNNLAWVYAESGSNLEKAGELSRFAVRTQPKNVEFLNTLAFVYFKMGRLKESKALLKKALALEPENARVRKRLKNLKKGRFL
ncbi:MAG: tetratricopeptide repeat protein, partial [Deltaproteobacteria bacterium]|nr:tetratricopeptide repeat protein [Deltaproteobacteria bacterium]